MKIGIILHPYGEDKPAGLGRFIFELVKAMLEADSHNQYILFLKNKPKALPQFTGSNWKIEVLGEGRLWLENLRKKPQADIYIFNTPVMPFFWRPKKSIVIAFDFAYKHLTPRNFKEWLVSKTLGWYHGFSIRRANMIVATSEATKRDIIRFFKIPENKIQVIYTGFNKICDIGPKPLDVPRPYFLFTGVIKQRKNVLNLVKGFKEFDQKHSGYNLVIAGNAGGDYADEVRKHFSENNLAERVLMLGYVSDAELSYLYKNALAFAFPSFVEGFIGLPILEAMDCWLAVLASKTSPLAEIGGKNSAVFADPDRPEDIAAGLEKLAFDEKLRSELIQNGYILSQRFSWPRAAKEINILLGKL